MLWLRERKWKKSRSVRARWTGADREMDRERWGRDNDIKRSSVEEREREREREIMKRVEKKCFKENRRERDDKEWSQILLGPHYKKQIPFLIGFLSAPLVSMCVYGCVCVCGCVCVFVVCVVVVCAMLSGRGSSFTKSPTAVLSKVLFFRKFRQQGRMLRHRNASTIERPKQEEVLFSQVMVEQLE